MLPILALAVILAMLLFPLVLGAERRGTRAVTALNISASANIAERIILILFVLMVLVAAGVMLYPKGLSEFLSVMLLAARHLLLPVARLLEPLRLQPLPLQLPLRLRRLVLPMCRLLRLMQRCCSGCCCL